MSLISDIIARLTRNEDRVNDFVNGDSNKVVDTDNGPIPSLAKLVKDNQEKIDAFMPAIDDKQDRLEKDASGGYVGIGADFMIRVKNAVGDVASWLTTNATAVRTWTLPDDSGELALKKNVPAAETKDSILEKLGATEVTGKNTGDQTLESLGAQAALGFPPLDSRLADEPHGFPVLDENAQLDPKYFPSTTKSVIYFNDVTDFPAEGEVDKLYVDTSHKKAYFWLPGNAPAPGSYESTTVDVGNTDTLVEGEENLFFSIQRVLDVTLYGFNLLTGSTILGSDTIVQAFGKAQKQLNEIVLAMALLAPKANPSFTGKVEVPDTTSANDDLRAVNTRSLNLRLTSLNDDVMQAVMQREILLNKAIDFSVVNNTLYPSVQAVKNYTDSLLVKVIKDCGNWDPNSGSYPTTGGSGEGGIIKAGNLWYVNVVGSFGGKNWNKGDSIRALIDNPGQTAANWAEMESNIGYVPVNRDGDTIAWLESKTYLQAGGGAAGQGGRIVLKDDGDTARWMVGLSTTVGMRNWQLYDIANARVIYSVDYQTGLFVFGVGARTPHLTLSQNAPVLYFDETDQSNAVGKWRIVADQGNLRFDINTAAARDFSTYVAAMTITAEGAVSIPTLLNLTVVPTQSTADGQAVTINAQSVSPSGSGNGGAVTITAGNAAASAGTAKQGGLVAITAGDGASGAGSAISARGGSVTIRGGQAGVPSTGTASSGGVTLMGGNSNPISGHAGGVTLTGGSATSPNGNGGGISIQGGGSNSLVGGSINVVAGFGNTGGGGVTITSGACNTSNTGAVTISSAVAGSPSGSAGDVTIASGGTNGSGTNGNAGNVNITAGSALGTTSGNGGNVNITAGNSVVGTKGKVNITAPNGVTVDSSLTVAGSAVLTASAIGAADGLVPLGADSKIAAVYLPSYIDDVIEYATKAAMLAVTPGEAGKIYVVLADETNGNATWQYRWSGSTYTAITPSPGTTDAVVEGTINKYFTTARVLSTTLAGLSLTNNAVVAVTDTILVAIGKLQAQISAIPYDLAGGFSGKPAANEVTHVMLALRGFTVPTTPVGRAYAGTASTGAVTISLQKNGNQFGTISFTAANQVGTVTVTAATVFAAGDRLTAVFQSSADNTFSDCIFSLPGVLN